MNTENTLAYKLNKQLMATTEKFAADNPGKVDICVILGAANIFFSGLLVNAPSRSIAKETLIECHKIQEQLIDSTPTPFFGRGLVQNPEFN